jgi:translocation and assembly module TamB
MNGVVSKQSSLSVQLDAKDLKEVEAIAGLFRPSPNGHQPPSFGLAGSASFQGTVRGSMSIPRLSGQLIASNLQFNGSSWKTVRANLDASPSLVSVRNADLEPASRGRIRLDGSVALNKWTFANTSDVQINLNAAQLNAADLTELAGLQIPVSGTVAAKLSLHGTELNPAGNGEVTLTNSTAYGQAIQSAKLNFATGGDEVRGELSVTTPAGSADCKATVRPRQKTYTAQLTSSGIQLSKLEPLRDKNINATGVVTLNASGQGSFDNPQVSATVQIPKLTIQNQTVMGINLQADLANHVANASLTTSAVNTSIQAKARVALNGEYPADATLDTQQIPLVPLLAEYAPDLAGQINGETEIHATLHGPLKNPRQLEVHVTVPDLKLAYGNSIQLAAAAPIRVDYKDQVINVQRSAIRGTDTDLEFQGSIGTASGGPMALMLLGTVDLQIAQLFDPDLRSSGQIKFNLNSNGLTNGPDIGGHIDIVDASLTTPDLPVGLEHANGTLTVTKDRINVANFQGTMGGGKVTAQGGVAYRPKLQFDLGAIAEGIRVLYPQGMRESVDANLRLSGSMENAVLGGTVNLADLSFTPAFDLSSFIGQFSGGVAVPSVPGFSQNLHLRIGVHSSNDVDLVSRALSLNGSANLQVQGTAANPVILGRVNLAGGDMLLNGDRFVLDGGTIQFINPSETEPVVNLSVATTIQQYNITLRFEGTADQLRTQYSSDPALPQADIINLLAFGQTTEASAVNGAATTTNQAAIGVLASQVSSQVSSRISKVAGISQLSISPVLTSGTTQGPPGANITIQQRVTGNLFVTFSTNVASTQSQVIQGQYQVSPKVALSVTRDQNGGFGFDALIKKSW